MTYLHDLQNDIAAAKQAAQAALEEIVDVHLRDLKWGGPAMMDV